MAECHSTAIPLDTRAKLSAFDSPPVADLNEYRTLAGALHYLTLTQMDIAYAVQQVCLYMHDPHEPHLALIKHILRYVQGTLAYGLQLHITSSLTLTVYVLQYRLGCLSRLSPFHFKLLHLSR